MVCRFVLLAQVLVLAVGCGAGQRGASGPIALASVDPLSITVDDPTLLLDLDAAGMRSDQTLGPIITALLAASSNSQTEESDPARTFQDRLFPHAAEHCSRVTLSVRSALDFEHHRDSSRAAPNAEAVVRDGAPASASGDAMPKGHKSSQASEENAEVEAAMVLVHCPTGNEELAAMVDSAVSADPNETWEAVPGSPVRQVGRRAFLHSDGAGRWLMATTAEQIMGVLDLLAGGQAPEPSPLAREIAGAPESGSRVLRAGFVDPSPEAHQMNAPGTSGLTLPNGGRYAIGLDLLEERFAVTAHGVFADEASAEAAVAALSASRASLATSPPVLMLGLAGPLAQMELAHEGNAMRMHLPVERAVVDGIYRLVTSFIPALRGAAQQQGAEASGARSEEL